MCKALKGLGSIAILHQFQVTSVQERVHGFRMALAGDVIKVGIAEDVDGHGDRDQTARDMLLILHAHPDLKGVFAIKRRDRR